MLKGSSLPAELPQALSLAEAAEGRDLDEQSLMTLLLVGSLLDRNDWKTLVEETIGMQRDSTFTGPPSLAVTFALAHLHGLTTRAVLAKRHEIGKESAAILSAVEQREDGLRATGPIYRLAKSKLPEPLMSALCHVAFSKNWSGQQVVEEYLQVQRFADLADYTDHERAYLFEAVALKGRDLAQSYAKIVELGPRYAAEIGTEMPEWVERPLVYWMLLSDRPVSEMVLRVKELKQAAPDMPDTALPLHLTRWVYLADPGPETLLHILER